MNASNTTEHIRLWHNEFWLLALSEFLLSMAVYMLLPTMPAWLTGSQNLSAMESGLVMGAFGLGLFVLGFLVSYLVQHYRRNIVCMLAIAAVAALLTLLYYLDSLRYQFVEFPVLLLIRFAMGAAFGLSQMVLCSTLIIDTCESPKRTAANFAMGWFGRLALGLGPLAGLLLHRYTDYSIVYLVAACCAAASLMLLLLVDFPFRTPDDDVSVFCLDRFFLPHGTVLFMNLLLITIAFGLLLSLQLSVRFYVMMVCGLVVALSCWRLVFREAELKAEVVSGLILFGAGVIMMLTRSTLPIVGYAAPLFFGLGMGLIGSRFLLFFIKLSRHCQRGTSQSTFMLGWESGIAIGIGMGLACFNGSSKMLLTASLVLVVCALIAYHFSHNWFMENKNR